MLVEQVGFIGKDFKVTNMKDLFDSGMHPIIYNTSGDQTQRSEVYFIVILYFCQNSFFFT